MNRCGGWISALITLSAVASCVSGGVGPNLDAGPDAAGGSSAAGAAGAAGAVYDAGPPCSQRTEANCDPADDCGCGANLRCAQVFDSLNPWTVHTACIAVGTQPVGAGCAVDAQTHLDDCTGGTACLSNGCLKLCHVLAQGECAANDVCLAVAGYFADRPGIGVCQTGCDPLADACPTSQACYFDAHARKGVCATTQPDPSTGAVGGQGDACGAANSCKRGTACLLLDSKSPTGTRCATYCNPTAADPCPALGASLTCQTLDSLYPRAGMPTDLGICAPSTP